MSIFEPNIEQITISEQVAVFPDERSLVSQMKTFVLRNLCILNHQHYIEASGKRTSLEALQVKHAVTQISLIRHFGLRQIKLTANILKQSLRLNSFHQPSQMFVCCECSKPTAKFQLECKYSQFEYNHFGSCQF